MRRISRSFDLDLPSYQVWNLLTNIQNYPKVVGFCKKVVIKEPLSIGSTWYDCSTILFVPLKVDHIVIEMKPEEKLIFKLPLLLGGWVQENFSLRKDGQKTKINLEVTFDLGIYKIIEPILEMRIKQMIDITFKNVQESLFKWQK